MSILAALSRGLSCELSYKDCPCTLEDSTSNSLALWLNSPHELTGQTDHPESWAMGSGPSTALIETPRGREFLGSPDGSCCSVRISRLTVSRPKTTGGKGGNCALISDRIGGHSIGPTVETRPRHAASWNTGAHLGLE